jgi:predicted Zn-dependent protease with MMP-like domain
MTSDLHKTPRAQDRAPSLAEIEAIADVAFLQIPAVLRDRVAGVVIQVVDFPDDEVVAEMGLESPFEILGLYSGTDLTRKSVNDVPEAVDMIFLYRRPMLDYWAEEDLTLEELVRHVLIHEIGHHFGLSDDDMDALERLAEAEAANP